jgi:5-methylcytosine-specific restriction enzyme subunit McrC
VFGELYYLVYAEGNEEPARHVVHGVGIEIVCHVLDLSQPPDGLLNRMRGLAQAIASAHPHRVAPNWS